MQRLGERAYLDMANRILARDCDGILGPDDSDLGEKCIFDGPLDLLDLLNGLVMGEAVQEQINV
jgi:hypothetical protein